MVKNQKIKKQQNINKKFFRMIKMKQIKSYYRNTKMMIIQNSTNFAKVVSGIIKKKDRNLIM